MKHLMTLVTLGISLSGFAQQEGWEFPLQYNPDGNADGLIGLSDMLDLLALYGQEYPESFVSDTTRAKLDLGVMTFSECKQKAMNMGSTWRIMSSNDFHYWFNQIVEEGQEIFTGGSSGQYYHTAWIELSDGDPGGYQIAYDENDSFVFGNSTVSVNEPYSTTFNYILSQKEDGNGGKNSPFSPKRCVLATQVRPAIEYHIIRSNIEQVILTTQDSLNNGWSLLGGAVQSWSSTMSQTIWRWAE